MTQVEIDNNYGMAADLNDQWDEVDELNSQLYTVLRATTEGNPFDLVENCPKGGRGHGDFFIEDSIRPRDQGKG